MRKFWTISHFLEAEKEGRRIGNAPGKLQEVDPEEVK
jgi:hypothetical protein